MAPQFAIRPTIRNHRDLKRDDVIKTVAAAVGPGHKVDLKGYDLLILVEIYKVQKPYQGNAQQARFVTSAILTAADRLQNIVGMSVVGPDYDKLKRYNIEELRQGPSGDTSETPAPAPAPAPDATTEST